MSKFPLEPSLARMLVASVDLGCSEEAVIVAAMLSNEAIFTPRPERRGQKTEIDHEQEAARRAFFDSAGDHITFLNVYRRWSEIHRSRDPAEEDGWCRKYCIQKRSLRLAHNVVRQLSEAMDQVMTRPEYRATGLHWLYVQAKLPLVSCGRDTTAVQQAVSLGFFMNSARCVFCLLWKLCMIVITCRRCVNEVVYRCLTDDFKLAHVHPTSTLAMTSAPEYVVYRELVFTSKGSDFPNAPFSYGDSYVTMSSHSGFMRDCVAVKREWIDPGLKLMADVDVYRLTGQQEVRVLVLQLV